MTATFNPTLATPLDKVRFRVGDIEIADAIVQDETITALLSTFGATVLTVSLTVAQNILAVYSRRVTYDVDGQGERWSDAVKAYRLLVDDLIDEVAAEKAKTVSEDNVAAAEAMGGGIIVGGLSKSSNARRSDDPDRAANYSPDYGW